MKCRAPLEAQIGSTHQRCRDFLYSTQRTSTEIFAYNRIYAKHKGVTNNEGTHIKHGVCSHETNLCLKPTNIPRTSFARILGNSVNPPGTIPV